MDDYGEPIRGCGPIDYEVLVGESLEIPFPWAYSLDGDTIASSEFELDGLTADSTTLTAESETRVAIDFTNAQAGRVYCLKNTISTALGRNKIQVLRVLVRPVCPC